MNTEHACLLIALMLLINSSICMKGVVKRNNTIGYIIVFQGLLWAAVMLIRAMDVMLPASEW